MRVMVRYYKRWDPDLLALVFKGYDVPKIMRQALTALANGENYSVIPTEPARYDPEAAHIYKHALDISDPKTVAMLKAVRIGHRNMFCKTVLRNALARQNLAAFFEKDDLIKNEIASAQDIALRTPGVLAVKPIEKRLLTLEEYKKQMSAETPDKKQDELLAAFLGH